MSRDVLLVDDDRIALANYANEIRLNLGIDPFVADSPEQALDILRYYPIKVLITDQEMPSMRGTELVNNVRNVLGLKIPCIMLTGFHDAVSVHEAVVLGFFGFINKLDARSQLTQTVRQAIQHYDMDELSRNVVDVNKLLTRNLSLVTLGSRVELKLVRVSSVVDPFIRESEWLTVLMAQRNLAQTQEIQITRRVKTSYEYGINYELMTNTGFKAGKLLAELQTALQSKISQDVRMTYEGETIIEAKETITVSEITDTLTSEGLTLHSREYQAAPVYVRINCLLQNDCSCCRMPNTFSIAVDIPTKRVALRQVEHFDKGPTKVIYTGFLPGTAGIP